MTFKRDWTARKPYYMIAMKGPDIGKTLVIINERKLVTREPHADLISSLEEMIATLKAEYSQRTP